MRVCCCCCKRRAGRPVYCESCPPAGASCRQPPGAAGQRLSSVQLPQFERQQACCHNCTLGQPSHVAPASPPPPAAASASRQQAAGGAAAPPQRETDAHRLAQRQKQIDLGKNTLGYQRYRQAVPRWVGCLFLLMCDRGLRRRRDGNGALFYACIA
jgi:hypothetical protein